MDRKVAIINLDDKRKEIVQQLIIQLSQANNLIDEITVFSKESFLYNSINDVKVESVILPEDKLTLPKSKNYVAEYFKVAQCFDGFLYIFEDTINIKKQIDSFITSVELMMKKLDYNVWFNTCCDECNYILTKFNPRMTIVFENEDKEKLGFEKLIFTSHSNPKISIINLEKYQMDKLRYDEDFTIPMFYIIEFLARRKHLKLNDLYLMNQYLTVEEENGLFIDLVSDHNNFTPEQMQKEDQIFKSKNVDITPDNNIDGILELVAKKLDNM